MLKIYHNPRCTKSRECLAFFDQTGEPYEIVRYLEAIPTFDELKDIINKLGISPIDLVRQKESIWIENYKGKVMTDDEVIAAMISHPILIERPIVINGNKAVIARPIEKTREIL